jgi:hypothetical protein
MSTHEFSSKLPPLAETPDLFSVDGVADEAADQYVLPEEISSDAIEEDVRSSKLRKIGARAIAFASGITSLATGDTMTIETAENVIDHVAIVPAVLKREARTAIANWRAAKPIDKLKKPIVGSLALANAALGESAAFGVQGFMQSNETMASHSLIGGIGAAALVEFVATTPIAFKKEHRGKKPMEDVIEATAAGVILGGAFGVELKKLPPSQMLAPILGYMAVGTPLAFAGEINNAAAAFVDNKFIIPAIVAWGIQKKIYDKMGWKSVSGRMADATVGFFKRQFQKSQAEAA